LNDIAAHSKKLIEVALPLDEINVASVKYKAARVGTIRNIHKWFAAMPLPAWRALIFAALIDDPEDDERRAYLLDVIKRLVVCGADIPDADTLAEAREIIRLQFPEGVPPVMDPFCGGGSTLVEAQRLGLPAFGSDLNPVPVLITRTLTELLPRIYGQGPIHGGSSGHPEGGRVSRGKAPEPSLFAAPHQEVIKSGYAGLLTDLTYYAEWVRDQAWEQLEGCYPVTAGETQMAWIWARTATCPNPACGIETVLSTSWWLSKKKGDLAWIQPRIEDGRVHLDVLSGQKRGEAPDSPKVGRGASFNCLGCSSLVDESSVIQQGQAGSLGLRMVAVVADRDGRRIYRGPADADVLAADSAPPVDDFPEIRFPDNPRWFSGPRFGFNEQADLYTPRQLATLAALADLVAATHQKVIEDGGSCEWADAIRNPNVTEAAKEIDQWPANKSENSPPQTSVMPWRKVSSSSISGLPGAAHAACKAPFWRKSPNGQPRAR